MKVIEKRVFSRLLSYVLAVALMAGLMPGVVAKAKSGKTYNDAALALKPEMVPGDIIDPDSNDIYVKVVGGGTDDKAKLDSQGYSYELKRVVENNEVHYKFYEQTNGALNNGQIVAVCFVPKSFDTGVIHIVSGSGTGQDPYVFEVVSQNAEPEKTNNDDQEAFETEKKTQKDAAEALLKSNDSEACKKLVEDAKKAIEDAKYNDEKTLDENKAALKGIVTKLEKDLEEQRIKDADTVVHPDGSKTVTEVKTSGNNTEITVTDYNKDGSQLAQYIYNGASGENLDLRTINYSGKNIVIPGTVTGGGKTYKVTRLRKNFMKKCKKARKVDVGENVNRIDKGAFNGGKKVRYITIRGKLKKVGAGAFKAIKKGTNKFKTSKKVYRHNVKLVEKSGLNPNIKVKRIKKK